MKLFSKIAALFCCAVLLLACVSCSNNVEDGVPSGMKNATAAGAEFRLYVPSVWNVNTAYGVSGAYFTMSQQSTVSAVKYDITDEMNLAMAGAAGGARLDWFWENECKSAIDSVALGGSLVAVEEDFGSMTLGGLNAHKYHLQATVSGNPLHFVYVIAEKDTAFYVIEFLIADDLYVSLLENINSILENFVFAEPYSPDDYAKSLDEDADAPEGMKLASNDDVSYQFYVPTTWTVNREETIFAAYLESDRSSVSVVPYMPDVDSMSVAEFFALCEEMMKNTAGENGYELLSTEALDLGGRKATAYTYRYTVGGVEYRYLQVVAAYKSMIYSLTYTALPENFEAHLSDVNQMIDAFVFR